MQDSYRNSTQPGAMQYARKCHELDVYGLSYDCPARQTGKYQGNTEVHKMLGNTLGSTWSLGGSQHGDTWPRGGGESSCNVLGLSYVMPTCGCKLQKALPHQSRITWSLERHYCIAGA